MTYVRSQNVAWNERDMQMRFLRKFQCALSRRPSLRRRRLVKLDESRMRRRWGRTEAGIPVGVSKPILRTQPCVAGIELKRTLGALPLCEETTPGTPSRETILLSLVLSVSKGLWISTECEFAARWHATIESRSSSTPQVPARMVNFRIGTPSQRLIATGGFWIVSSNRD